MVDTLLFENKPLINKDKKGTDELEDTLLSEKKTSTKKAEKDTDEKADTLLSEKKPSMKDVEKGTNELEFIKRKLNTIRRKGLNQFEGQSARTQEWFKLDIELKKQLILKFIQNSIKNCLRRILNIKTRKCIQCLLCSLIKN